MIDNTKGMSLVEVMVAMGLTAGIGITMATLFVNQQKAIEAVKARVDQISLTNDMRLIFSEPKLCVASLASVRLSPTERGLNDFCYTGVNPTTTTTADVKPSHGGEFIKNLNGKKSYGSLGLSKFCLKWENELDSINDPNDKNTSPTPIYIRGVSKLVMQGERNFGGPMREEKLLLKILLEKLPQGDRFNILNKGNNYDIAEPTTAQSQDRNKIRPVNASYFVKSCSTDYVALPPAPPKSVFDVVIVEQGVDTFWGASIWVKFIRKIEDNNNLYNSSQPDRLTIQKDGNYDVYLDCVGGATITPANTSWSITIFKMPSQTPIATNKRMGTPGGMGHLVVIGSGKLKKGDYIQAYSQMSGDTAPHLASCHLELKQTQ